VSDPSGDALQIISSIVTVSSLVGGAYLLLREDQSQAESQESQEHRPSTRCPSCHGQGTEECMCVRWSDGDKGCATCNQTGLMKCRRCGGGGTAVPALIKVRKERQWNRGPTLFWYVRKWWIMQVVWLVRRSVVNVADISVTSHISWRIWA
jgi:hypothetical protein